MPLQQHALPGGGVERAVHQVLQEEGGIGSVHGGGVEALQNRQGVSPEDGNRRVRRFQRLSSAYMCSE